MDTTDLRLWLEARRRSQGIDSLDQIELRELVMGIFRDWLEPGVIIPCEICRTPMKVHDSTKRYCSAQCRQLASLRRRVAVKTETQERS